MARKAKKAKTVTLRPKRAGQRPVTFRAGGLHRSTGTPQGEKIPRWKILKALAGGFGPRAKKQAVMAEGMLKKGRKTAAKRSRKRKKSGK